MSNEGLDADISFNEFKSELLEDYKKQHCTPEMFYGNSEFTFMDYLIARMYGEGLPAKEPMIIFDKGASK